MSAVGLKGSASASPPSSGSAATSSPSSSATSTPPVGIGFESEAREPPDPVDVPLGEVPQGQAPAPLGAAGRGLAPSATGASSLVAEVPYVLTSKLIAKERIHCVLLVCIANTT